MFSRNLKQMEVTLEFWKPYQSDETERLEYLKPYKSWYSGWRESEKGKWTKYKPQSPGKAQGIGGACSFVSCL